MAQTTTQIATDAIASVTSSTSKASNFNVGSLVRSLIDAFAAESAVLEQQTQELFAQATTNAPYQLLDLAPAGAVGSVYSLQFTLSSSATSSVTLAAGEAAAVPGSSLQWLTAQPITLTPGQSASTTAACTTTGAITNVPANSITQLVTPTPNVTVTNLSAQPTVLGRDAETQVQLQAQLGQQVNRLQRGIPSSVEAGALTSQITDASGNPTEQVVKAREIDSTTYGLGFCYVFNGSGPMSSALLTQTQNVVNGYTDTGGVRHIGYKAAGVTLTVKDAPETTTAVTVAVLPQMGSSLSAVQGGVQDAIQTYFANLDLGATLSVQQLTYAILAVPGVADAQISVPSASLAAIPYAANPASAPVLTAVTVTPATALAAGTYTVGYTWTNEWGQTLISPTATATITAGQAIGVGTLTLPSGIYGVDYYLSAAGGTSVTFDLAGTGVATNLTAEPASGAASPPSSNTAQLQGNAYILGAVTITQAAS